MDGKKKWMGSGALLLAAVIWGFGYVVISDSLDLINVHYLMSYRYLLAAVGMAVAFWRQLPGITRPIVGYGAVLGALLYFSQFVQTVACGRTTAGKVSFITGLYVVLVPLCGAAVFRQRLCRGHWVAICLALPGLFFLTSAGVGFNYGDALALAGSFGFAIHMLASERFVARSSAVLLSMLQFAWAAVFSTVTLLFAGEPLLVPELTVGIGMRFLFMGLVSTLLGFFLQMWGQKQVPASLASMLLATEALFGLLFSVLLLDEVLTSGMVLGGALMLAAILVAERVAGPSDVSIEGFGFCI